MTWRSLVTKLVRTCSLLWFGSTSTVVGLWCKMIKDWGVVYIYIYPFGIVLSRLDAYLKNKSMESKMKCMQLFTLKRFKSVQKLVHTDDYTFIVMCFSDQGWYGDSVGIKIPPHLPILPILFLEILQSSSIGSVWCYYLLEFGLRRRNLKCILDLIGSQ